MDENDTKHAHDQHGEPDQKMEISQKQTNKSKTTNSEHHKVLMVKPPLLIPNRIILAPYLNCAD